MADSRKLGIYLNDGLRQDVADGQHNFFGIVIDAFQDRGFQVELYENSEIERMRSEQRQGYSLFHLETPNHDRALDVRLAYLYPFWRIERAQWRDEYQIAKLVFDPTEIDGVIARKFTNSWRKRLLSGDDLLPVHEGFVLVALQGRLLDKRHGQSMSPVAMIDEVLDQDRFRRILLKLHPNEKYSREEVAALEKYRTNPRVQFSDGDIGPLIRGCDYIVTQTSSVAFKGLLHNKPSILFGAADFHHIFQNVSEIGTTRAFRDILSKRMPYAKYFYWFLQLKSINAGRKDAAERIVKVCREQGWQI